LLEHAVVQGPEALAEAFNATAQGVETIGRAEPFTSAGNATGMLQSGEIVWGGYLQMLGTVFLLLAILFLAFYLLKKFGPRAGLSVFNRGDLKMEAQLPLGPKRSVVVVRFLNKRLVVGVTETQINLLTTMEVDQHVQNKDFSRELSTVQKDDTLD
jgi:flagellar protein FliO/FliZ